MFYIDLDFKVLIKILFYFMAKLRYTFDGKTQYKHKIYQKKKKPLLNDISFDVFYYLLFHSFFLKIYIYIV